MRYASAWLAILVLALTACGGGGGGGGGTAAPPPVTFTLATTAKTAAHPWFGLGSGSGFTVDDGTGPVEGRTLTLERGRTYRFVIATGNAHPVYLSTGNTGADFDPYSPTGSEIGGDGQGISSGMFTFTPDGDTPNTLSYQCVNHEKMGGMIQVVPTLSGLAPPPSAAPTGVALRPAGRCCSRPDCPSLR